MAYRPADANLDPARDAWFHGTRWPCKPGDILLPRALHGASPTSAPLIPGAERLAESDDYVYITRRYGMACAYAHRAGGDSDPVVLLVTPLGPVEPDPESYEHLFSFRCASARVDVVDDDPFFSAEDTDGWKPGPDV